MFKQSVIDDIVQIARDEKLDPAALLAVCQVESAGVPYWNIDGKEIPAHRIEGHYFDRRLTGKKQADARAMGLAHPKAGRVKNPRSYRARWQMFNRCARIDRAAAIESTSWGLGQVMGAHWKHLGYSSANALLKEAMSGVDGQVRLMVRFIKRNGLEPALRDRNWKKFAYRYNGPAYKQNRYDTKMAQAYAKYAKQLKGSNIIPVKVAANAYVLELEKDLKLIGINPGKVDGLEDTKLTSAIKRFQESQALVVDGIAGKMTREALDAEIRRQKSQKSRKTTTQVATVGALAAPAASQASNVIDALSKGSEAADTTKSIVESLNLPVLVGSILVALVVGFVVYKLIQNIHDDNEVEEGDEAYAFDDIDLAYGE